MEGIVKYYYNAKKEVYNSGYFHEIYWQDRLESTGVDAKRFLSEHAWVVLSGGMKEEVIRLKFPDLSKIFSNWNDPVFILTNETALRRKAMKIFAHRGKIDAIISMSAYIVSNGLASLLNNLKESGSVFLESFPYLGPATSKHLAKNLGYDIAKPDRHLIRISKKFGYDNTNVFCANIADLTGDKVSVIDIVLWRYATLNRDYLNR